jgi:ATP-dependent Lhr-like helicase
MGFPSELAWAHPIVAEWFVTRFGTPTEPQVHGWQSILEAKQTLISTPTDREKRLRRFWSASTGCSDVQST